MRRSTQEEYARRVLLAQRAIETALDEPPTPRDVARRVGMAPHHFHRVFRGQTGESVMQYARRLRLERAARPLRSAPPSSLLELALEAGYGSHEAFTRAFTTAFGRSPSAYRDDPVEARASCPEIAPFENDVEVRREPKRELVAMRHTGPFANVPATWERLHGWWGARGASATPRMYGLVHDDPTVTTEALLRYDACLEVDVASVDAPAARTELPAGLYAVARQTGPYDRLHELYLGLVGVWFPRSGYVLDPAPTVEWYVNSPHDTPAEGLVTEIWVRIEERGWITSPA
ncbi:MAG: AraC family transcriptional regulator [Deltaproteobacteria bacterium]